MPAHLTLLSDAVQEFISAFAAYRSLEGNKRGRNSGHTAAVAVRSLYIAFEKAFKHALALRDPYLVVDKLDPKLLASIVKDRHARPVPSVFCVRPRFDTIGEARAWEIVQDQLLGSVDRSSLSSFSQAFARLCETRHKVQHSELYEDLDEVVSSIEQVLQGVRGILGTVSPEFLQQCYRRNAQLESRLAALENKLDGAWAVFCDFLSRRREPFQIQLHATSITVPDGTTQLLFKKETGGTRAELTTSSLLPSGAASGLFAEHLDSTAMRAREARRSVFDGASARVDAGAGYRGISLLGTSRPKQGPLLPVVSGRIEVPAGAAWLSLHLPRVRPPSLNMRFFQYGLVLEFGSGESVDGSLQGFMLPPVIKDMEHVQRIAFGGVLHLEKEYQVDSDEERGYWESGATIRHLTANIRFEKPIVTKFASKTSRKTSVKGAV
jgi:hypothetical protein